MCLYKDFIIDIWKLFDVIFLGEMVVDFGGFIKEFFYVVIEVFVKMDFLY